VFTPDRDAPDPAAVASACAALDAAAPRTRVDGPWRSGAWAALADTGLLAGFIPLARGGSGAREAALVAALVAVAEHCLTTALAITQWAGAVRLLTGGPADLQAALLPALARGERLATVGISQLTTSRQHTAPALTASRDAGGWRLDGLCPWVTGADSVDTIVTGAATADGGQRFFIVETAAPGLTVEPPLEMLALSGSRTSAVHFVGVRPAAIIAPADRDGPRTGGLATTALAVGSTRASLATLTAEATRRADLMPIAEQVAADVDALAARLAEAARIGIDREDRDRLRADANGLVIRAAQAALVACKGAGFVRGHPVERLVRESMFFLVWSCPQAVTHAVMCDLMGTN